LSRISFGCLHGCYACPRTFPFGAAILLTQLIMFGPRSVPRNNYAKWIRQSTAIWNNSGYGIDASHV